MTSSTFIPLDLFRLLGHDLRWQLAQLLVRGDHRVQDLVAATGAATNLVSYHLHQFEQLGLLRERRSDADGRDVFYNVDVEQLHRLYRQAGAALHPAFVEPRVPDSAPLPQRLRVLVLCTHNSARSQLAEALLRQYSGGSLEVVSAGTEPTAVHPLTVELLRSVQIDPAPLHAKSVESLHDQHFDYVITVCDRAHEVCPAFPEATQRFHWSLPDPAAVEGDTTAQRRAFERTLLQLASLIRYFLVFVQKEHHHDSEGSHSLHRELGPLADG
ncbi:MAG: metalloregulator ArsR/SmtB family transcription factor [Roseiflexaceae bacterium]